MTSKMLFYIFTFSICIGLFAKEKVNFSDEEIKKINEVSGLDSYLKTQKVMDLKNAEKRWGVKRFNSEKFKKAGWKERAPIAVDILKRSQSFIGIKRIELLKRLGRHDGFFFRDHIPAYIIEDQLDGAKESWQIIFLLGMDQKVAEIRIFQN